MRRLGLSERRDPLEARLFSADREPTIRPSWWEIFRIAAGAYAGIRMCLSSGTNMPSIVEIPAFFLTALDGSLMEGKPIRVRIQSFETTMESRSIEEKILQRWPRPTKSVVGFIQRKHISLADVVLARSRKEPS